jgi:hypothetical protein
MEKKMAGWNKERNGRIGCMRSQAEAYEKDNEAVVISQSEAISCRSDRREPSKEITESTKALMIAFIIITCCC